MKRTILQSPLRVVASATTLVFALTAIAAFSRSASAWLPEKRPALIGQNSSATSPTALATFTVSTGRSVQQAAKERIGSEVITITRFGFETTEVIRPAGKFFLLIENRSGLNPITLRLKSERGERIIEVTQPEDQLDWADQLNLSPGKYTLTLAERPEWVCDVTITRP